MTELWIWRHPRAHGAQGRCIGRTDLAVDARRAKRLAHRIRAAARRHGLPWLVWTSPLARCKAVGRALQRMGFAHRIDARLAELDFGAWDGQAWNDIAPLDVAAWEADFAHHAPGHGESLDSLRERVRRFAAELTGDPALVVGHAGWISMLRFIDGPLPASGDWPAPTRHGALTRWRPALRARGLGP
jgi:alpha-ribazole phosphatase